MSASRVIRSLSATVVAASLVGCSAAPGDVVTSAPPAPSAFAAPTVRRATTSPWAAMHLLRYDKVNGLEISDETGVFRATGLGDLHFAAWGEDGSAMLATRADGVVLRCGTAEPRAAKCREVFALPGLYRLSTAPGGRRYLGVPDRGEFAWVIDASTGERRATPAREGAWLDDHRIAYVRYPGKQMHVWDVDSGTDTSLGEPITAAEVREVVPSPDARWIEVVTRQPEVHPDGVIDSFYGVSIQDAATGAWFAALPPKKGGYTRPPLWSPDSARLAYVDEGGLTVIEGEGPFQTRALTPKAHTVLGWLDAKRVAYLVLDHIDDAMIRAYGHGVAEEFSDLWVIDVDTGEATALTQGGALTQVSFARMPSR